MEDIRIRLALDGADAVQAGANKVSAGLDKIGQSGQKVQAALSGQQMAQVSAQLQDFFIQIQGGQAPLTALLQQGSQLSTVFGGAGNAFRAVTSLITPTVAGLGALAGGVGATALAWHEGTQEGKAYARSIVETGNAAGVTLGQLKAMAQAQSQVVGTQGDAAQSLTALVSTGRVSRQVLDEASEAVTRYVRVGGDLAKTVDKFADLGKDPLGAIVKINEAENFLTETVYKQIKALTEQNRLREAANLAQQTYATTLNSRTKEIEANLGSLEGAWKRVGDVAKGAWDKMLNVGRPVTLQDRAADVQAQIEAAEAKIAKARSGETATNRPFLNTERIVAAQQRLVASLKEEAAALDENLRLQNAAALKQAERAAAVKSTIKADEDAAKASKAASRELEQQAQLLAELAGLTGDFYEQWNRLNALYKAGKINLEQLTAAQANLLDQQPAIAANAKAELEAAKAISDARASARRAEQQAIDQFDAQQTAQTEARLASIRNRTAALQLENQAADVARNQNVSLAEAINQVTIARLEDQAARFAPGSDNEQAIRREIALMKDLAQAQSLKDLNSFLDPNRAQTFGEALAGAFDQAGSTLSKLTGSLQQYAISQRDIAANVARLSSETDPGEKARKSLLLQQRAQQATINLYANMAGAAKGFFKEGTDGYKALQLAETAFTAYQLASDLAKGTSAATVAVATQGQGDPYTAWARMAAMAATMASLGYQVAGFFGGGGGGSTGGDGAQQATGQGTVLGAASALSESISRSTEQLASTAQLQLTTQSGMLAALRNIENNIGGLAALVVRGTTLADSGVQQGTTLSLADPFSRGLFAKVGDTVTNKIYETLFGKKVSVTGQGLAIDAARLGAIADGGSLNVRNFTDVNAKQKVFGITVSNKNSTNYSPADPVLQQQFSQIFKDLYSGILSASTPLGFALDQVESRLDNFVLNIGKIELKDLNAAQIQEKLAAVIGAAADNVATAAIPGLQDFQRVGEGYFETIVRVASGVETAEDALARLGIESVNFASLTRKQGDVAAEIVRQSIVTYETVAGSLSSVGNLISTFDAGAEDLASTYKSLVDVRDVLISVGLSGESLTANLIQGAGSLDDLASGLQAYLGGAFFSDQERAAAAQSQLQAQFARIGIDTVPQSYAAFRALVESLDDGTAASQFLQGQLIALADDFEAARQAIEKTGAAASRLPDILKSQAAERDSLAVELLTAQGNAAGAAALKRQQELAKLTEGLTAAETAAAVAGYDALAQLRQQVTAAAAETQRLAAAARERDTIQARIDDLTGNTAAIRAKELLGLDASNRALQERYYALLDERKATEDATRAAEELASKQASIAAERDSIQARIDDITGNTAAIRAKELAGLDESNRTLQERLYALQDAAAAQEVANRAAEDAARVAAEQARAAEQLRDAWKSIGDTLAEEAQRILGLDVPDDAQTLASAKARFASTNSLALAGDQDSAKLLPELGRAIVEITKNTATSRAEVERAQAQVAAALRNTAGQLGSRFGFSVASSSTVDVPALLAQLAATAPITSTAAAQQQQQTATAAQNDLSALVQEVRALNAKVDALQSAANRSAAADERTRDLLIQVTDNGNAVQVEEA